MVSSTPRPHFTPGKDLVPILQEAGWAPGPVWTFGKSRPHRDSIPDRSARSQSLYRLSYPANSYQLNAQCLFITYIYCISPTCFGVAVTIIRENIWTLYLKLDIIMKLLTIHNTIWFQVKGPNVLADDGDCDTETCRRNTINVCN